MEQNQQNTVQNPVQTTGQTTELTVDLTTNEAVIELQAINSQLSQTNEYLGYCTGLLLFIVIVILCDKIYKFFNIFF